MILSSPIVSGENEAVDRPMPADVELDLSLRQVHGDVPALRRPRSRDAGDRAGAAADNVPALDDADHRLPASDVALLRVGELSAERQRGKDQRFA